MMELSAATLFLALGAGVASVLSPCVLPVVPILLAGADRTDRLRPVLLVAGLSVTFVAMGVVSSLFGALLVGKTRYVEIAGAAFIVAMGVMVILDASVFKRLSRLSGIRAGGEGRLGAFALGLSLGLVWVPCVGPFLSSVLAMVGTSGQLSRGTVLLGLYSLGLAVPMLAVAFSSHLVQSRIRAVARHEALLRWLSGGTLVAFGLYFIVHGNAAY